MQQNVQRIDKLSTRVHVVEYCWGDTSFIADQTFDLIIGSDITYDPSLFDVLTTSLVHLASEKTIIFLALQKRDPADCELLFSKLGVFFKFLRVSLAINPLFGIFQLQKCSQSI